MGASPALRRHAAELLASLLIWSVPLVSVIILWLRKRRLRHYLDTVHHDAGDGCGAAAWFESPVRFGAFLFDPEDGLRDPEVARRKRGVLVMLVLAVATSVGAVVLNYLSDRYLADLLGL